jgi:hypothetical protein
MAFKISFFNTPKHRVFNYTPIYYDPMKEKLAEKAREREGRLFVPGKRIRGSFSKALYENRRHAGDNRYMRIVILLTFIVLIGVIFYFANGLELLFKLLSNK